MSRKNIYQLIQEESFDVSAEYRRLCKRIRGQCCFREDYGHSYTMEEHFDGYFEDLFPVGLRSTCLDFSDLLGRLGLSFTRRDADIDDLSSLIELVACARDNDKWYKDAYNDFMQSAELVMDKAGLQLVPGPNGGKIVIPRDCKANQAAELLIEKGQEGYALEIFDYKHASHKGNLKDKEKILVNIGKYIEPIIDGSTNGTCKNARFLLNNMGLRHNNEEGKHEKAVFSKMPDEEKEKWYDKTYDTIVAVIVNDHQNTLNEEIEALRKKFKSENGTGKIHN